MCTGLKLTCRDGSVVAGRTAEFGIDLDLRILFVPAGMDGSSALGSQPGMTWTTQYAAVGIGAFDNPSIVDGFNDAGLTVAGVYFSQYADYVPMGKATAEKSMNAIDFSGWALGTCASTRELAEAVADITIADIAICPWYGRLVMGEAYDAGEFLSVHEYRHVIAWAERFFDRPAVQRGRIVNKTFGDPSEQLWERHDASDFETKTQD